MNKIIIKMEGGLIETIFSQEPAQVLIIDTDTEGLDESELTQLYEDKPKVYARTELPYVASDLVESAFERFYKGGTK